MTELHPKAKELIRLAKSRQSDSHSSNATPSGQNGSDQNASGQEPSAAELHAVMEGFQRRANEGSLASVSALHGERRAHGHDPFHPTNRPNRNAPMRGAFSPSAWFENVAHHSRHGLLKWSLLAAIMTGSLGAFANWGPREWRDDLGQLADQVTESIGELVISVTGRGTSSKRGRATVAIEPPSSPSPASVGATEPEPATTAAAAANPDTDAAKQPGAAPPVIAALDRSSPPNSPRFAAPEPASLTPKANATPNNTVTSRSSIGAAPSSGAAGSNLLTSSSTASTASRGPSAFSEVEVNLISAARSALAAGNYAQTRSLLGEHRTTFPHGALSEERETLRALVACRESGNTDLARRYIERRPQSLFAPRLMRECGLATPLPISEPKNDIP